MKDQMRAAGLPSYVRTILDVVVREVRPERVVLFGSYAWGTATAASDVDLLVVAESSASIAARSRPVEALLRDRAPRTDLLWRTPAEMAGAREDPLSFLVQVQQHGRVVYDASIPATKGMNRVDFT